MSKLLEPFDKSLYQPVFQNKALSTEAAIELVSLLNTELDEIISDYYVKIPHALSAIFICDKDLRIDIERSLVQQDPYIKEETLLSPPEAQVDRFWRRSITRLTYLVCQMFASLLTGTLSANTEITLSPSKLVSKHSPQETEYLQKLLVVGLAKESEKRYQNFQELRDAFKWLDYKLSHVAVGIPSSATSQNLPKMPRFLYQQAVTTRVPTGIMAKIGGSRIKYEIQIWNPSFKNAAKIIVDTPSMVLLGRKPACVSNKDEIKETTQVQQEVEEKEGKINYTLLIEGDQCLSRKHMEIHFPDKVQDKPTLKDLGSTHGIMVFRDRSRNITNSSMITAGSESSFLCPEDQHFKLGNTYLRIRPIILPPES